MCVCVREKERERERESVWMYERIYVPVYVFLCVRLSR